jgi:ATP diphosphatase
MADINPLLEIMRRLRDPQTGCPWDIEQTFKTIVPYTLEEAYEVADVIEREDWPKLHDELGDLLFQVVFYARMAEEQGMFGFDEIMHAICDKLIRRHPHVFSDHEIKDAEEQTRVWEALKEQERKAQHAEGDPSILHDIPRALPALTRAGKLQRRAARVGLDWPAVDGVFDKLIEELDELRAAVKEGQQPAITEELGDLLFTGVNLARHLEVDAEQALREASQKFEARVRRIETLLGEQGESIAEQTPEQLDELWRQAKKND